VEHDAVACELDRGLEEVAPRELAEGAVRCLQADRGAWNCTGGGTDVEDLGRAAAEVDVDAVHLDQVARLQAEARNGDEEVEDASRTVARAVHEHEAARAGAGERALRYPADELGAD